MNYNYIFLRLFIALSFLLVETSVSAQVDSLDYYLQEGLANNPLVQSRYASYQAMLEKIPQAKAYQDPTVEIGIPLKSMPVFNGKPVADFKLMQKLPWFGTRSAARYQAREGAKQQLAAYCQSLDELTYQIKQQWYTLCMLKEKKKNALDNQQLYKTLKELALEKYASSPTTSSRMNKSSMSDVLRVELELLGINNEVKTIASRILSSEAQFNALLNRSTASPIKTSGLHKIQFSLMSVDNLRGNPLLKQQKARQDFYAAKYKVDKLMGYPTIGIGVKYSWTDKRMGDVIPVTSMNGKNMIMPMLSFSLPLYRSKYRAMKRESRLNEQAALKQYQSVLTQLEASYIDLSHQLSDADRTITLYQQQVELAEKTYQLMLKEYATSQTDLSTIILVQKQLLRYQFEQLVAVSHYNILVASFEKITSRQPLTQTSNENN